MSSLFDQDRFILRLKMACTQMPIYKNVEEIKTMGPVIITEAIEPRTLPHWPTQPAFEARIRAKQLKAPAGQISLIPFEKVWQHLYVHHSFHHQKAPLTIYSAQYATIQWASQILLEIFFPYAETSTALPPQLSTSFHLATTSVSILQSKTSALRCNQNLSS